MKEFYRVMAAAGCAVGERPPATVAEVCEAFLESRAGLRPNSVLNYAQHLRALANYYPGVPFRALTREHVLRAAEGRARWRDTMKHHYVETVSLTFSWAREAGYLDRNPLAGWTNPYVKAVRSRGMTDQEFEALLGRAKDAAFREALLFMRGTGCRTGEMVAVRAAHVHPDRPLVVLPPALHKTGRVTGRKRVLVMPAAVEETVRRRAKEHPDGPVFRNSLGRPWQEHAFQLRVRRYRRDLGLSEEVVPHLIRHAHLTKLLEGGVDPALAAKIAGHSGTAVLQSVYYHPDVARMVEAVEKAAE
jgi:integrase